MKTNNLFDKSTFSFNYFPNFFKLILFQIFRNPRSYVFCLIIPAAVSFLLIYSWTKFYNIGYLTPPLLLLFILIGYIFSSYYVSINLFELRSNNFFSRVKVLGVSKLTIVISYFIISFLFSLLSFSVNLLIFYFYSFVSSSLGAEYWTLSNIKWFVWLEILFSLILINFFAVIFFIAGACLFRKKVSAYLFLTLSLVYILIFSEIILIPSIIASNKFLLLLSYLSPVKYSSWVILMFSSYMNFDYLGFTQIFVTNYIDHFVSFKSVMIPIFVILTFSVFVFLFIMWKMKFSIKY